MPLHLDRKSTPGPQSIDWQRVAFGYEARIAELETALREIAGLIPKATPNYSARVFAIADAALSKTD